MDSFSFRKAERLKSRKQIGELFSKRQSVGQYPLRLFWMEVDPSEQDFPVRMAFSVPKKKFRKAAHRNRVRRRVKEAYRLRKEELYNNLRKKNKVIVGMLLFVAAEDNLEFTELEHKLSQIFKRLSKIID